MRINSTLDLERRRKKGEREVVSTSARESRRLCCSLLVFTLPEGKIEEKGVVLPPKVQRIKPFCKNGRCKRGKI